MILTEGFIVFRATAQPAKSPPPPVGITTASTSGTYSQTERNVKTVLKIIKVSWNNLAFRWFRKKKYLDLLKNLQSSCSLSGQDVWVIKSKTYSLVKRYSTIAVGMDNILKSTYMQNSIFLRTK
jgi:hypothetical protein